MTGYAQAIRDAELVYPFRLPWCCMPCSRCWCRRASRLDFRHLQLKPKGSWPMAHLWTPMGNRKQRYTPVTGSSCRSLLVTGLGYEGAIIAQHAFWMRWWRRWSGWCGATPALIQCGGDRRRHYGTRFARVQSSLTVLSETLAAATAARGGGLHPLAIRSPRREAGMWWSITAGGRCR